MIIAIDGPAAAGKGTLSLKLKQSLNYPHLDTGALYRAVAVLAMDAGYDLNDEELVADIAMNLTSEQMIELQSSPLIRTPEAGNGASKVSVHPKVRSALLDFQRSFGEQAENGNAILDGRDIGTVIFPNAELKFFVTASPEVRAKRRFMEFQEKNIQADYNQILEDVKKRDERDMNRLNAPLKAAEDAIIIDTSVMTEQEVFDFAMKCIKEKI